MKVEAIDSVVPEIECEDEEECTAEEELSFYESYMRSRLVQRVVIPECALCSLTWRAPLWPAAMSHFECVPRRTPDILGGELLCHCCLPNAVGLSIVC